MVLRERSEFILRRLTDIEGQLAKLLDLYLSGDFPKDVLSQRKSELEKLRNDLTQKYNSLARQLEADDLSDDQVAHIEEFCTEICEGLDNATLEEKRRYLDLMNVQGNLVQEDGERVVYIQCRLGKQRLVLSATLPSPSNQKENNFTFTARLVIDAPHKSKPVQKESRIQQQKE